MKKRVFVITLLLMSFLINGDDKAAYLKLLEQNNLSDLFVHLQKWEKKEPGNPEVFIGYFNYFLKKGSKSGISIDKYSKQKGDQLAITDPKTGETVAYFNDSTVYNFEEVKMALQYLDKGLEFGPNRLDMHFGKLYILGEIMDYKNQSKILIKVLNLSAANKNKWLWDNSKPLPDSKEFMLDSIQDYYQKWFNEQTAESLEAAKVSGLEQIKLYPSHIYGYNNLATVFIIKKQYSEALTYLLKAEKIDSSDLVVINNIANCYKDMNNNAKAKEYYEKMIKSEDKEAAEYAKKQISKLK